MTEVTAAVMAWELLDDGSCGRDVETVGLVPGILPAAAQQPADLVHGLIELSVHSLRHQEMIPRVGEEPPERLIGNDYELVSRLGTEGITLAPVEDTQYTQRLAVYLNQFSDRALVREQRPVNLISEDRHGQAAPVFAFGEEPAFTDDHVGDAKVLDRDAGEMLSGNVGFFGLVANRNKVGARTITLVIDDGGDTFDCGTELPDGLGVVIGQQFSQALVLAAALGFDARRPAGDQHRLRPEAFEKGCDVPVQTCKYRPD